MNTSIRDYQHLHSLARHSQILKGISSLLNWDQETYMPAAAGDIRAEQQEALAGLIHKETTGKKFKNALSKLIDIKTGKIQMKGLSSEQTSALREWHRDYVKETALPQRFVEKFAKLTAHSIQVWREAKIANSFTHFIPSLEHIISMSRKKADLIGYKEHPYDALLDLYEHEVSTKEIKAIFSSLSQSISPLLKKITAAKQVQDSFLYGKFSQDKQIEFGKELLKSMGYDSKKGRLDLSTHPFSSACHPNDNRITTRIHPSYLYSNISAILHEGGHGLYEMGLPTEQYGTPLGEAISLGMHESQSRWWETLIGLSRPFWQYWLPLLQKYFKGPLEKVTVESFYLAINKVKPSFIRVEADEVTYNLHVILRFELEKALIEGSLKVKEIPEAWNSKMQEFLGITPKTDSEGCLQDIHWSMGGFGYFPSYTLGNIYASHLFSAFSKDHPKWEAKVSEGELTFIREWLHNAVYKHGRRYTSKDLLKKITGKPFSADAFVQYLTNKYQNIYQL